MISKSATAWRAISYALVLIGLSLVFTGSGAPASAATFADNPVGAHRAASAGGGGQSARSQSTPAE